MAGNALFDIKVDTRGLDKTIAKALRDVKEAKRLALIRTANNVKRWMLEAISNNGGVVHRETGAQIVPPFTKKSELHDVLHGTGAPPILSKKKSVLLRVDAAAGTAQIGWGGPLEEYVQRWQDGTVGGERRLRMPKVRSRIYRILAARGYGIDDHAKAKDWLDSQIQAQPTREFVDCIAAYTAPLMAEWYEANLVKLLSNKHDAYLSKLLAGDESTLTRRETARKRAAAYKAYIESRHEYKKTEAYRIELRRKARERRARRRR